MRLDTPGRMIRSTHSAVTTRPLQRMISIEIGQEGKKQMKRIVSREKRAVLQTKRPTDMDINENPILSTAVRRPGTKNIAGHTFSQDCLCYWAHVTFLRW